MAEIRQMRRREEPDPVDHLEHRIFHHKLKKVYWVIIAIVVLVLLVSFITISEETRTYTGYKVNSATDISISAEAKCVEYAGNLLTYSKDGASCVNSKGKSIWNVTYQMQDPMVVINGSYVAIADYNGNVIYVMNLNGKQGEISANMPVRQMAISKDGIVAAVLDQNAVTYVYMYDSTGKELVFVKSTMEQSGYPFQIALSDNGEILAVHYLYMDSTGYKSRLAYYNFNSVGQNYADNYVSGYDYDTEVIGTLHFMNDATSFSVTTDHLYFYSGKQIPTVSKTIDLMAEVESVFYDDDYVGLFYRNETEESEYLLDIYGADGSKKGSIAFSGDYTNIRFCQGRVFIYSGSDCRLYTMKGQQKLETEFSGSVLEVLFTSKYKNLSLVRKDKIEIVELT